MHDYKSTSHSLVFNCPFCTQRGKAKDTKYHLYYYLDSNLLICYRCGFRKGSVEREQLEELLSVRLILLQRNKPEDSSSSLLCKWVDFDNGHLSKLARAYLTRRGFSYAINPYNIKVGVEDLTGFIVFPMYDESSELAYYVARRFNVGSPKTYNPRGIVAPLYGFKKVYNTDLILVEGCFDRIAVERAGFTAFAILGNDISGNQLKQLDRTANALKSLTVMLDGDAVKFGRKLAKKLHEHYATLPVKLAVITDKKVDPGDLDNESITKIINHALPYPYII